MKEKHFVATGFVVRDGKTLLLLHKKLGRWLPPGGHIDEGELPEEALRREIREETGLEVENRAQRWHSIEELAEPQIAVEVRLSGAEAIRHVMARSLEAASTAPTAASRPRSALPRPR